MKGSCEFKELHKVICNFWCFPFKHSCETSWGEHTYFKSREIKLRKWSVFLEWIGNRCAIFHLLREITLIG